MKLFILLVSFLLCHNLYGAEEETKSAKTQQTGRELDWRVAYYVLEKDRITPLSIELFKLWNLKVDLRNITLEKTYDTAGLVSLFDGNPKPIFDITKNSLSKVDQASFFKGLLIVLGKEMAAKGQYEIDISNILSQVNKGDFFSEKQEVDPSSPWYGYSVLSRIAYESSLETGGNTRFYGSDDNSRTVGCRKIDQCAHMHMNNYLEKGIKNLNFKIAVLGIVATTSFVGAIFSDRKFLCSAIGTAASIAARYAYYERVQSEEKYAYKK